jgi:hypothetical protein
MGSDESARAGCVQGSKSRLLRRCARRVTMQLFVTTLTMAAVVLLHHRGVLPAASTGGGGAAGGGAERVLRGAPPSVRLVDSSTSVTSGVCAGMARYQPILERLMRHWQPHSVTLADINATAIGAVQTTERVDTSFLLGTQSSAIFTILNGSVFYRERPGPFSYTYASVGRGASRERRASHACCGARFGRCRISPCGAACSSSSTCTTRRCSS